MLFGGGELERETRRHHTHNDDAIRLELSVFENILHSFPLCVRN